MQGTSPLTKLPLILFLSPHLPVQQNRRACSDVWHPDWALKGHKRLARSECQGSKESVARCVLAYDLETTTGTAGAAPDRTHKGVDLSSRRVLFDLEKELPGGANETGYPVSRGGGLRKITTRF